MTAAPLRDPGGSRTSSPSSISPRRRAQRFAALLLALVVSLTLVAPSPPAAQADPTLPFPVPVPPIPIPTGIPFPTAPSAPPAPTTTAAPAPASAPPKASAPAATTQVGPDECAASNPDVRPTGGPVPTKKSDSPRLIPGSDRFGVDSVLLEPAGKMLGMGKPLASGKVFPEFVIFDGSQQGQGIYNEKTRLQSGLVCAIASSLVDLKLRRDVPQKLAAGLLATPTLLAGLEGPDIAAVIMSGSACAIQLAQAAAAGAMAGGSGGAAAAAAAPAGIAAIPSCVAAAGDTARIAGKVINVWEHNPMFPQVVEFAALLDPDTPIGAKIFSKLPKEFQVDEVKGILKTLSRFNLKLSEVWIGKSISIFGDAVSKAAAGDSSGVPGAAIAAVELGIQVISAAAYALTGSDELKFGGETIVDTKMLVNQMSRVYSGGLTRLPGESSGVVQGGTLGGQTGTTQPLRELDLATLNGKQVAGPIGCLMGTGAGAAGMTQMFNTGYTMQQNVTPGAATSSAAGQPVVNANAGKMQTPEQLIGPVMAQIPGSGTTGGQQQATTQGPVLIQPQQQLPQQCNNINGKSFSADGSKTLSQSDIDALRSVPGLTKAQDPAQAPNGAIWGLDANDPNGLLSRLPFIGLGGGFPQMPTELPNIPVLSEALQGAGGR